MRSRIICVACLYCLIALAAGATENDGDKPRVTFDGQTLVLAWEGQNAEAGETTREFIPADQTLDRWTKLASIREYPDLNDPRGLAEILAKMIQEKYQTAPSSISDKSDSEQTIVDFAIWPEDRSFVEFNVFKYRKRPEGGTIAEQYAVRDYTDPEAFLKNLGPLRDRLVKLMTEEGLKLDQ